MAVIYRTTDRIKVKVDDITVVLAPLSYKQKCDVQSAVTTKSITGAMDGAALAVRYSLKEISGVKYADGSEYKLKIEDDKVSEECMDELFNLEQATKLTIVCLNLIQGVPKSFTDPETGKPLDGVSILKERSSRKKT